MPKNVKRRKSSPKKFALRAERSKASRRYIVLGVLCLLALVGAGWILARQRSSPSANVAAKQHQVKQPSVRPADISNPSKELVYLGSQPLVVEEPGGTQATPNYVGFIDTSGCSSIGGWAADRNRLNVSINVEWYDGSNLIAIVPAFRSRPDVATFLGDNGLHGFTLPIPALLSDGTAHTVHVKFENSTTELTGSPVTVNCPAITPNYIGFVDVLNCTTVGGWAADKNRLNQPISVSVYDGSTLLITLKAGQLRTDVGAFLGDNGLHGYSAALPAQLTTGTHNIHIEFETGSTDLSGSPKTQTCP